MYDVCLTSKWLSNNFRCEFSFLTCAVHERNIGVVNADYNNHLSFTFDFANIFFCFFLPQKGNCYRLELNLFFYETGENHLKLKLIKLINAAANTWIHLHFMIAIHTFLDKKNVPRINYDFTYLAQKL